MEKRSIDEIRKKYRDVFENSAVYAIATWRDCCPCGAEDGGKQEPFDEEKYRQRLMENAEGLFGKVEEALNDIHHRQNP